MISPAISGMLLSAIVPYTAIGAILPRIHIHTISLVIMMLLFAPLWFINLCILNTVMGFMLSIGTWLFPASQSEVPKNLNGLIAIIPTLLELYWLTTKLNIGIGYWGAFSWQKKHTITDCLLNSKQMNPMAGESSSLVIDFHTRIC